MSEKVSHELFQSVLGKSAPKVKAGNLLSDSEDEGDSENKSSYGPSSEEEDWTENGSLPNTRHRPPEPGAGHLDYLDQISSMQETIQDLNTKLYLTQIEISKLKTRTLNAEAEAVRVRQSVGTPLLFGVLDRNNVKLPSKVEVPKGNHVRQMAVGMYHSLAVLATGKVYVWGRGADGQLGLGDSRPREKPTLLPAIKEVKFVAAGGNHSFAVTTNNIVYGFGNNSFGQLGVGSVRRALEPTIVKGLPTTVPFIAITTSRQHTLFLAEDGELFACGRGNEYQLGTGDKRNEPDPTRVVRLAHHVVKQIAAGETSNVVIVGGDAQSVADPTEPDYPKRVRDIEHRVNTLTNRRNVLLEGVQRDYSMMAREAQELEEELISADAERAVPKVNELVITCKLVQKMATEGFHMNAPEAVEELQREIRRMVKSGVAKPTGSIGDGSAPDVEESEAQVAGGQVELEMSDSLSDAHESAVQAPSSHESVAVSETGIEQINLSEESSILSMSSIHSSTGKFGMGARPHGMGGPAPVAPKKRATAMGPPRRVADSQVAQMGLQRGAELQKLVDTASTLYTLFTSLKGSSLKEITRAQDPEQYLHVRRLIRVSSSRIHDLRKDAMSKFGNSLGDPMDPDPIGVMMRMFLDSADAREALNSYAEGILEQTLRKMDRGGVSESDSESGEDA